MECVCAMKDENNLPLYFADNSSLAKKFFAKVVFLSWITV